MLRFYFYHFTYIIKYQDIIKNNFKNSQEYSKNTNKNKSKRQFTPRKKFNYVWIIYIVHFLHHQQKNESRNQ